MPFTHGPQRDLRGLSDPQLVRCVTEKGAPTESTRIIPNHALYRTDHSSTIEAARSPKTLLLQLLLLHTRATMPDDSGSNSGDEGYEFVDNDDPAIDGLNEGDTIQQCLFWIPFTEAQIEVLIDEAFATYDDISMLNETDIEMMAKEYASRSRGRISWGGRKLKLMKGLMHWTQDFYRASRTPSITGLTKNTFRAALNTALRRDEIRYNMRKQMKTAAEAASPGPLESERKWKSWEEKFTNYCRAHIGAFGVPLSYVIRENDEPEDGDFPDFVGETIARAPLSGEYFEADRLSVFNMIVAFTTDQPSGDWVKSTLRYNNGRRSMKALRDHFAGEGNATRTIADADRLKESLHYKSERALAFESFLTGCQKMFNIYEREGEPMAEDAKVRFLFKKVQHKDLLAAVEALQAQITAGSNITYTKAANHLSAKVSTLPEYLSKQRTIAGVAAGSTGDGDGDSGIYNADGSINTGYIPNWRSLSDADKDKVRQERKRLGIKKPSGKWRKGSQGGSGGDKQADANRIKQLVAQNKKYKRSIKAIKRRISKKGGTGSDDDDSDSDIDAGDQFGGKHSKKKKKSG